MRKRRRKTEISIFNVILCMVVVLIHLMSKSVAAIQPFPESLLYKIFMVITRLTTFVVQGFVFLSAMKTFLNGRSEKYGSFLRKRIKTIIIPYIIAVLMYYIYFFHYLEWFEPSWSTFLGYLFRGDIAAQFYFVIVIVQFYLLYPLWRFVLDRVSPMAAITISAAITAIFGWYAPFIINSVWGIDNTPWLDRVFSTYLVYWVCGMYAGKYYDSFRRFVKRSGRLALTVAAVFGIIDSVMVFMRYAGRIGSIHLDMIHALFCISVIIGGIYISYILRHRMNLFLKVLDQSSYYIYLVHVLFIDILDYSITSYHVEGITLDLIIRSFIVYSAVFIFAWLCYYIKKGTAMIGRHSQKGLGR